MLATSAVVDPWQPQSLLKRAPSVKIPNARHRSLNLLRPLASCHCGDLFRYATRRKTAKAAMTGDADPHALVQALAQTELAVETAVTIRNKVVEAYQEILRMPV